LRLYGFELHQNIITNRNYTRILICAEKVQTEESRFIALPNTSALPLHQSPPISSIRKLLQFCLDSFIEDPLLPTWVRISAGKRVIPGFFVFLSLLQTNDGREASYQALRKSSFCVISPYSKKYNLLSYFISFLFSFLFSFIFFFLSFLAYLLPSLLTLHYLFLCYLSLVVSNNYVHSTPHTCMYSWRSA
jgi:hypothetical protein